MKLLKILTITLIIWISGCTQATEEINSPNAETPTTIITTSNMIDLAQISTSNNFTIYPSEAIDFGVASLNVPKIQLSLFLKNSSSQSITYRFKFPSKNGFSMRKNLCLETIRPNEQCEIAVLFDSSNLKDGTYFESVEVSNSLSSISTLLKARVVDRPDNSSISQTQLSVQMRESFIQGNSIPYRGITIQNTGSSKADLLITVPSNYLIRTNDCKSFLSPGETCYLEVLYQPYKTQLPVFGLMYVRGNFPEKVLNLLSGSGNVSFVPIYSPFSSNTLTPCQGVGIIERTIQQCQVIVDNVNYGNTELTQCNSFATTQNLTQSVSSPSGNKYQSISNGTIVTSCLSGQQSGIISYNCNSGFHEENNSCLSNTQICSVLNGIGQKNWNGSAYSACIPTSCSSSYHIEGLNCVNDTYFATYDSNNLNPCDGSIVQFPTGCNENWGNNLSTNLAYCIGQSRTIQSPAGFKNISIPNGTQQTQCLQGQTTGSNTISCNSGFHNENGSCVSNIQACADVVNSTSGVKTWNGSSYGTCQATSCISGYHLSSGQCVLNTYSPIYPTNPLQSCDGTISNVDPSNCREDWGTQNIVSSSFCFSSKGTYISPQGIRTITISNGEKDVFCVSGSTNQNLVAIRCQNESSPEGYHSDGNNCVPNKISCSSNPAGAEIANRYWDSANLVYGSCQIESCSASYVLFNGSCVPRTYIATYPVNTMNSCTGSSIASPIQCFESWGNQNETSLTNCVGMFQTQYSPAGSVLVSIPNGQKLVNCAEGSTTGSETLLCSNLYHEEGGSCVYDIKNCEGSELSSLNADSGYKAWLGSSYTSCQITTCSGQGNIDGSGYHLENNSCVPNTSNCSASELSSLNAIGGIKLWGGNSYGACLVNSCSGESNINGVGFHLDLANNLCQPNTISCSSGELSSLNASLGSKIWNGSSYGSCQISNCLGENNTNGAGYHLNGGTCVSNQTNCESFELSSLNATSGVKKWQGSSFGSCEPTSCSGQTNSNGTGYHLEGSSCISNQSSCTSIELSILNATSGQKIWNGSSAFGSCQVISCSGESNTNGTGYHLNNGSCLPNQSSCSPSELLSLNALTGFKNWDGSSAFGSCQVSSCSGESNTNGTGYHLENGNCLSNQISCQPSELSVLNALSGFKNWNGSSAFGSCQVSSCLSTHYQSGNSCLLKTYNPIFSPNTLAVCDGTVVFHPVDCKESWSSNSVNVSFCSGMTINYQSPAGTIITTIPHGFRTDTCSVGSSTPNPSIATCTELSYVSSGSTCIFNSAPILSGNINFSGSHFKTRTPMISFSAGIDNESNTISYEYSIGTSSGGTQITNWTNITPTGTTTLSIEFLAIPEQPENTPIFVNIRAKDIYNYYSNILSNSFTYQLGWPYGLQSSISGSSGACSFSSGNLVVSGGTCVLPAGQVYDFNNLTIDASGILQFSYDVSSTYNLDPTNNPGNAETTNGIKKYTILGVKGLLTNNGLIVAENSPFLHATSLSNSVIAPFTIPMPSGSQASSITNVSIGNSASGNGSTYKNGIEYGNTNADGVPFSTGGLYGGAGGGIYLYPYISAGPSSASDGIIYPSSDFYYWDPFSMGMNQIFVSSQKGLACGSSNMNATVSSLKSTNSIMPAGGHGGKSDVNRYFCGSAGAGSLTRYNGYSIFVNNGLADGYATSYGSGGGGARGANGQVLVIHSHSTISGNGAINARGQAGGNGASNLSCNAYNPSSGNVGADCSIVGSGRGGNGAGGSGGKVWILTPDNTRYFTVRTTAGISGTGGFGGTNGQVGSSTFILSK